MAANAGPLGDRHSLEQAPFGVNHHEGELRSDCFDGAHRWCFVRELYLDFNFHLDHGARHDHDHLRPARHAARWRPVLPQLSAA